MKRKYRFYDTGRLWTFRHYSTLDEWLRFKDDILLVKRYLPPNLSEYGIKLQPKRRHRRSMCRIDMVLLPGDTAHYTFTREARPIGRKKHGKWLYMPKRILLGGNN